MTKDTELISHLTYEQSHIYHNEIVLHIPLAVRDITL